MTTLTKTSTLLANGIAHVSFPGGSEFLPIRNVSDRQSLADTVTSRAHLRGRVQVLLDDQRWMIQNLPDRHAGEIAPTCGVVLATACYAAAEEPAVACCVDCVFSRGGRCSVLPVDQTRGVIVEVSR